MAQIHVEIDNELLEKAAAVATLRGVSVSSLLQDFLGDVADDVVSIALPAAGAAAECRMLRQSGRDQVVAALEKTGWQGFEPPMPALFHACARLWPGRVADVGANTGYYSLLAAAASAENDVLAFEPDAAVLGVLRQNLRLNPFGDRITVAAQALSDRAGPAMLYVPTQEHGLVETSSSLEPGFKPAHSKVVEIEAVTLDLYLERAPRYGQHVTLIKIDVEGHEAAVLGGANATVARSRPIIFIEVLPVAEMGRLSGFVAQHGYLDVPLRPQGLLGAHAVVAYHQGVLNHALVPQERAAQFLTLAAG